MTRDDDDDDDDDEEGEEFPNDFFGPRGNDDFSFGFHFGPGGMRFHDSSGFSQLFQDLDELFSGAGAWDFPSRHFEIPSVEAPPPSSNPHSEKHRGKSLRDWMLKYPDSHLRSNSSREGSEEASQPGPQLGGSPGGQRPSSDPQMPYRRPSNPFRMFEDMWKMFPNKQDGGLKEDKDLDSQVTSEGLDKVLKPSEPKANSYFKSVSITKVTGPDGTVEERRTVRDSQGNEETTVTRTKGDQTFITTSKKDEHGQEKQAERMINMDDRDLAQFTEEWKQSDGAGASDLHDAFSIFKFFSGLFSNR
ncbi:HCLS1-associated protein X-1 isoform X2 [Latimeria chalumnae]